MCAIFIVTYRCEIILFSMHLQVLRGGVEKRGKAVQFLILLHEVNWDSFPRKLSVSSYCVEFPSPIKGNSKTAG